MDLILVIGSRSSEIHEQLVRGGQKDDPVMEAFKIFDKNGNGAIKDDYFIAMLESTGLVEKRNHGKNVKLVIL